METSAENSSKKSDSGIALIKSEFLNLNYKPRFVADYLPEKTVEEIKEMISVREKRIEGTTEAAAAATAAAGDGSITAEPQAKKPKLRGRNKKRPVERRPDSSEKLCRSIVASRVCSYGDRCKFSHDVASFLESRPRLVGTKCYMFETYGRCSFGVTCLFAEQHTTTTTTDNMTSVVNQELCDRFKDREPSVKNVISKDLQIRLRKREYNFKRANKIVRLIQERFKEKNENVNRKTKKGVKTPLSADFVKSSVAVVDGPQISVAESTLAVFEAPANVFAEPSPTAAETPTESFLTRDSNVKGTISDEKEKLIAAAVNEFEILVPSSSNGLIDDADEPPAIDKNVKKGKEEPEAEERKEKESVLQERDRTLNRDDDDDDVDLNATTNIEEMIKKDEFESDSKIKKMKIDESAVGGTTVFYLNSQSNVPTVTSGCITDEDLIRLRPGEKKKIDFKEKLYLAPLTTVGNLPFRRVCKRLGADITCGEMAMPSNLLQGQASEWALLKRHESETLFGMQLCGSFPDSMTRAAQVITEMMEVDFIDINIGCPIDLVVQKGEGCALMGRIGRLEQVIHGMSSVIKDVPLTVKMRTGLQEDKANAHTIIPKLRDWGVSMVTVHGRSREQRYTKLADWKYIKSCVEVAKPMDLFGNGDILSFVDYNNSLVESSATGCMIARGSLIKPWVFTEIKEQRHWDIAATERLDIVRDFVNYGLEHWGSDQQGVANTRRFLLEWLSFSHRYIPLGILERFPQRINEKPPHYIGRSDLETLLSSPNCADWIKISEMFLGPVPTEFTFLPKHRANAFQ